MIGIYKLNKTLVKLVNCKISYHLLPMTVRAQSGIIYNTDCMVSQ